MTLFNRQFRSAGGSWLARFLGGPDGPDGASVPGHAVMLDPDTPVGQEHPFPTLDQAVLDALDQILSGQSSLASQATLLDIKNKLLATIAVTGPLTDAQLGARGLATAAGMTAVADALTALFNQGAAATPAGENHIGQVGGHPVVKAATIVSSTNATPYDVGDCLGTLMTFNDFVRTDGGSGTLAGASIQCKTSQVLAVDLVVFKAPPVTNFVDNTAFNLGAADFDKIIDVIHINDWSALGVGAGTPSFGKAAPFCTQFSVSGTARALTAQAVLRSALVGTSTDDFRFLLRGEAA